MAKEYVENVGGAYRVAGSRVSLDSVVYAFLRGESPDGIAESFPALSLEQVYGAIAFYLAHRDTIDAYLSAGKAEFARLREQTRRDHPSLYAKIEAARGGTVTPRG
ncbi:MAG: DUF433 domain-containing protein [Candidatus Solibacter usitatus]|nr:DUF433 domain-containing protein [Candidatus Solibacter usitatus]